MALFSWANFKIEFDDSGGTLRDISAYVTSFNGWTRDRVLEEITAAGDSNDRWADVGILIKEEVVMSGPYDDQSNSLVEISIGAEGSTRTLQLTFDVGTASDVQSVETIIKRARYAPSRNALTNYELALRPTGAIT